MSTASPSRPWNEFAISALFALVVAIFALWAWDVAVKFFDLPKALLPTPGQVWQAAIRERQALFLGTMSTGIAAFIGLAAAIVIGSLLAIVFSQSQMIRLALFPYVILLQTVPVVAIAPLLITWSGYTFRTVVIVTTIVCVFPIINTATAGLMNIDRDKVDLFRLYGAGRIQRLMRLQIPAAIGHLVVGTKTSSALAVIGAIVAEFFVGNGTEYDGLGTLMTGWQGLLKTDALIAAVVASAILGLTLFGAVQLIGNVILRRWTRWMVR